MNRVLISKSGGTHSSILDGDRHLLNVSVNYGFEKEEKIITSFSILFPISFRSWKNININYVNFKPEYILTKGDVHTGAVAISIRRLEANNFKVELKLVLDHEVHVDDMIIKSVNAKYQAKYDSVSIKESSYYNCYRKDVKRLDEVLDTDDYLINQPIHQFNGAIGYAVKI